MHTDRLALIWHAQAQQCCYSHHPRPAFAFWPPCSLQLSERAAGLVGSASLVELVGQLQDCADELQDECWLPESECLRFCHRSAFALNRSPYRLSPHTLFVYFSAGVAADQDACPPAGLLLLAAAQLGLACAAQLCLLLQPSAATTQGGPHRDTPLHLAALSGDVATVRAVLETLPAAAATGNLDGQLPLHLAAMGGCAEAVSLILAAHPAAVTCADSSSNLPIHHACLDAPAEVVQMLLDAAPETATAVGGDAGSQPIHCAASNAAAVRVLLACPGVTPTAKSKVGATALHNAAAAEDGFAALELLVAAAPEACRMAGHDGWLPVHVAAVLGDTQSLELLLQQAPDTCTASTSDNDTAIHLAAQNGHAAAVRVLLAAPGGSAAAASVDANSATPLWLACKAGHVECVRLLIEAVPGSLTTADDRNLTPLHAAAFGGHMEVARALLGAAPRAASKRQDMIGNTPLHTAIMFEHREVALLLLDWDPDAVRGECVLRWVTSPTSNAVWPTAQCQSCRATSQQSGAVALHASR